jgi:glycerol-3-phosphate dehydrogenase
VYDLLTLDRNRGIAHASRRIPAATTIPRSQALGLFPQLPREGLTGAAVFSDAQMYNPPRLTLAVVRSAVDTGAVAANYVEVDDFELEGDRVIGVSATDRLSPGQSLRIRGRFVLNAAGPYAETLLRRSFGRPMAPRGAYSRDACFVVNRLFDSEYALAVPGRTRDPDAKLSRGARHLFLAPWRDHTLVGVWHSVYDGDPTGFRVTEAELAAFLEEIRAACPALEIGMDDVSMVNSGLVPFGQNLPGASNLRYGHRSRLIDHRRQNGLEGLATLVGVRYTTGRADASEAVDLIMTRSGRTLVESRTETTPVWGGAISDLEGLHGQAAAECPGEMDPDAVTALVRNHGTDYRAVLAYAREAPDLARSIGHSTTLAAEVVHAVRDEMAVRLTDVLFRRTELGTGQLPESQALEECAALMSAELGWSPERTSAEIAEAKSYPGFWQRSG